MSETDFINFQIAENAKADEVVAVIDSCITPEQYSTAIVYAGLWLKVNNSPLIPGNPVLHALERKRMELKLHPSFFTQEEHS